MEANFKDCIGVFKNAYPKQYCEDVISDFQILDSAGFTYNRQESEGTSKMNKDDRALFTGTLRPDLCPDTVPQKEALLDRLHFNIANAFNQRLWECYSQYQEKYSVLETYASFTNYSTKVQKTIPGGGYHLWHTENADPNVCRRVLAYILYLNDVEEGGETEFLYLKTRIKAEAGTLIFFPSGLMHAHRGNPPLKEDKYIVTGWLEF